MSSWEVEILPDAERMLRGLEPDLAERVVARLRWLAANLDVVRPQPLHSSLGGFSKLRVGDLRVVYTLDRKARRVHVHLIGRRDEIYKSRG